MKKFLFIPMIAVSLTLPLMSEEEKVKTPLVQVEEIAPAQEKLIDEVLADYHAGNYNSFLKQVHSAYAEANKKWEHDGFLEARKKLSFLVTDFGTEKGNAFKKEIATLHEAQDRELVKICIRHPNEKTSKEVRDMIFFTPSEHEQASIDYLHALSHKFKGDGSTPLENKLIAIDTEFWLKSVALGVALTQNKVDPATYQKQHLVLQIEKVKQMKEACQGDMVDVKIKQYVDTAVDVLPKVHASTAARKHLAALGQGKIDPQNDAEKELQAVMTKYLEKEETLVAKHFPKDSQ